MPLTRAQHFRLARALLGAYVLVHFAMLTPYAAELLSCEGMLAEANASPAWVLTLPSGLLAMASWGTLALELSFAPVSLLARARPLLWGAMLGLHLSLLVFVQFADLTVGMLLLLHVLTFDVRWLHAARVKAVAQPSHSRLVQGRGGALL